MEQNAGSDKIFMCRLHQYNCQFLFFNSFRKYCINYGVVMGVTPQEHGNYRGQNESKLFYLWLCRRFHEIYRCVYSIFWSG